MTDQHNKEVITRAKPGDLLTFPRGFYIHWAVYIGNEEVVHFTGVDGGTEKGIVKRESFWKVVEDSEAGIFNNLDKLFSPRPTHKIVSRAIKKIGMTGYNLLCKNCEHFAYYCRNGVYWSTQANAFQAGIDPLTVLGNIILGWVAADESDED